MIVKSYLDKKRKRMVVDYKCGACRIIKTILKLDYDKKKTDKCQPCYMKSDEMRAERKKYGEKQRLLNQGFTMAIDGRMTPPEINQTPRLKLI